MPTIARKALIQRLQESSMLDHLKADARILFRKRLWFLPAEDAIPAGSIHVTLTVGAIELGQLGFTASLTKERNDAYRRWLAMAAQVFAGELSTLPAHSVGVVPTKILRAARLIQERHHEPLSLGDVAAAVGLSRERLSRLFNESLGINFSEYLTLTRLNTAQEQLRNSESPVTEIAFASGFQSISQFNRSFLKLEGCAPSEFRARLLAGAVPSSPRRQAWRAVTDLRSRR